ncbi:hypothetical protein DQP57_12250 [Mycobacterium colombiense]|uniref:Uncharacterized protein n=1 Tax=Mycobacterium colombiense TaxID=339268 RepID=A0A329LX54_9MYCO|nr:hypothetical protein DQP57_12250 [Mycobacterium colombiense]
MLWPDRFILERLAGPKFVGTDACEASRLHGPAAIGSTEPPLMAVDAAGARKMNPVNAVSKEVAAGGKCR